MTGTHPPMSYCYRSYCLGNEPTTHVVFICNKDGQRKAFSYTNGRTAKALMEALEALGFTKKRR